MKKIQDRSQTQDNVRSPIILQRYMDARNARVAYDVRKGCHTFFSTCSPIKCWMQSQWDKGKALANGLWQHILKLMHRINQAHMCLGDKTKCQPDWFVLNLYLQVSISNSPICSRKNKVVNRIQAIPGFIYQHWDLSINQFDACIYLLWAACAQRYLKITFAITVVWLFRPCTICTILKNKAYSCFSV